MELHRTEITLKDMLSTSFIFLLILLELCIVSHASHSVTYTNDSSLLEEITTILKSKYNERQEFCSKQKWWDEYKQTHAKILQSQDPRLLVFVPHLSGKSYRFGFHGVELTVL